MNVPEDLVYSEDHHWLRREPGDCVRLGLTEYAQDTLGDIVFVDLPATGSTVSPGDPLGEVESTKSVSEVIAPIAGEVVEVNDALELSPRRINEDPYGDGWICVLRLANPKSLGLLLGADTYRLLIDG